MPGAGGLLTEADLAGAPAGPPPGVPTSPGPSSITHGGLTAQSPALLTEDQLSQSLPDPTPQPPQAPGLFTEAQLAQPTGPQAPPSAMDSVLGANPGEIASTNWMQRFQGHQLSPESLDLIREGGSLVGKAMEPLSYPIRGATAATVKAAEVMGVPGAAELQQKINPEGRLLPDAYFSDVSDFYLDKAAKASGLPQMDGKMGEAARLAYGMARFGVGMGANILMDPLRFVELGTYTKGAEELQKVGELTNPMASERNLVAVRMPFTDAKAAIPMAPVANAAQKAADAMKKVPGVETLSKFVQRLSPDTGYADVDLAASTHNALQRGAVAEVGAGLLAPNAARNFTEDEKALIAHLMESTPNQTPNLPEEIISAAGRRTPERAARPLIFVDADVIRAKAARMLPQAAEARGVALAPGRAEAIVDGLMDAKDWDSRYLEKIHEAGLLNKENVVDKVLENHLPHVMDPNYRGVRSADEYATRLAQDTVKTDRLVKSSWLSSTDPTRYRQIRTSLEEANRIKEEESGLKSFFITDPHVAVATRYLQADKLVRDKRLLETVEKYGQRLRPGEASARELVGIPHPDFNGKTVVIREPDGKVVQTRFQDMVFPKEIAEKMSYYINKPAVTGAWAQLAAMNRINRATSFFSLGFWARNTADNMLKAVANGVSYETHLDTLKLFLDKSQGLRSAPSALSPKGIFYSGEALKGLLSQWGITTANAFHDGVEDFMQMGKRLTLSQALSNPRPLGLRYTAQVAEGLLKGVNRFGEKGENFSRAGLFLQRLKEGYTPEMASREVEKFLFDYTRNSQTTDSLRFFFPFIQHPIKTALVAPELLGKAPGVYNQAHNAFPHVLAAAFHDPMSQAELNTLLPDNLKARDAIAGPLLPGNTQLAAVFRNQNTPGNLGSLLYFDPAVGMRILNHFDYFNKESAQMNYGLSPLFGSLLRAAGGTDNFGRPLDLPADDRIDRFANRVNHVFWSGIVGSVSFHNTEQIIKQSFGIGDPRYFEPASVLLLKGAMGQFGGITNLDRDFFFKSIALAHERADLVSQLRKQVGQEVRNFSSASSVAQWVRQEYGQIVPTTTAKIYQELQQVGGQTQAQGLAAQAVQGKITAGDFAARIKNIDDTIKQVNRGYQFGMGRYLQMGAGAKSPGEARERAGVGR